MTRSEIEGSLRSRLLRFTIGTSSSRDVPRLSELAVEIYIAALSDELPVSELGAFGTPEAVSVARRELSDWQLVVEFKTGEGRKLVALPPTPTWKARSASFAWTVQDTPELLQELADTGDPIVDIARSLCNEIGELAEHLYATNSARRFRSRTKLKSGTQTIAALSQLFADASGEVLAMSIGPRLPQLALLWEVIERRLLRGELAYQRLVTVDEVIEHGLAIVRRDVRQVGVDLRVGDTDVVNATYYIFDREVLLHQEGEGAGTTAYKREVNGYVQKHSAAVARSAGALAVVAALQKHSLRLRSKARQLGGDAEYLLNRRIANGKFALRRKGWSDEHLHELEGELVSTGLLIRTKSGFLLPNYRTNEETLRESISDEPVCTTCWCPPSMCICQD